jgi:hypothetical protein
MAIESTNHNDENKELLRLKLQEELDSKKTSAERNQMGQFATPTVLATEMIEYAKMLLDLSNESKVRFIEPGFNLGSFYSALLAKFPVSNIESAVGYEIDPHYGIPAIELWKGTPLQLRIDDFTRVQPPSEKANLLICNPPYVRHHHMSKEEKIRLQMMIKKRLGIKLSGLSGLYCYFMCLAHDFIADNGLAGWLVPSEFMDVNYGSAIKEYLLSNVTLLHVHRFDPNDVQFSDAYVSSAVVWYKKTFPSPRNLVKCTYGGTLMKPKTAEMVSVEELKGVSKWNFSRVTGSDSNHVRVSELFDIKRGLATGANDFFILTQEEVERHEIPREVLVPILPSSRYLSVDEIPADMEGNPVIDKALFLINCKNDKEYIRERYPSLWRYFQTGVETGVHEGYLCSRRSPWYMQENRPAAPILCTYMGRTNKAGKIFRFILNHSEATASNSYLMLYPKSQLNESRLAYPGLLKRIWELLNGIPSDSLVSEGRVYGGGLYKLEPKELGNTKIDISLIQEFLELGKTKPSQLKLL